MTTTDRTRIKLNTVKERLMKIEARLSGQRCKPTRSSCGKKGARVMVNLAAPLPINIIYRIKSHLRGR